MKPYKNKPISRKSIMGYLELSTDSGDLKLDCNSPHNYSQEKIKVTPSSATESDNISGLASIGHTSAKDTKTPDQFSIEIPDKYISSLPYLTRQLNRKIWQGYQGG